MPEDPLYEPLEAAYWHFDTLRGKGDSERDAFKKAVRRAYAVVAAIKELQGHETPCGNCAACHVRKALEANAIPAY